VETHIVIAPTGAPVIFSFGCQPRGHSIASPGCPSASAEIHGKPAGTPASAF
jgi:hypothetical protein